MRKLRAMLWIVLNIENMGKECGSSLAHMRGINYESLIAKRKPEEIRRVLDKFRKAEWEFHPQNRPNSVCFVTKTGRAIFPFHRYYLLRVK